MPTVQKIGSEFRANTQLQGTQVSSDIAGLAGGRFVVTWEDESDPSAHRIEAQIFGADGAKIGGAVLANTTTNGVRSDSAVAGLVGGGFVVSWVDQSGTLGDSSGTSIKAQRFDANGGKLGTEFLVNTNTAQSQSSPSVIGSPNGGYIIVWTDLSGTLGDTSNSSIKAQLFASDGAKLGSEFRVNTTTFSYQSDAQITLLTDGNFVVSWSDQGDSLWSIRAQILSSSGAKIGNEIVVETEGAAPIYGDVAALAGGGFAVTWSDRSFALGDGSGSAVAARLYDSAGIALGNKFRVNTQTFSDQIDVSVAGLSNGGFVVSWGDLSGTLGDPGESVKAQVFNSSGQKIGSEFLVNTGTDGRQSVPTITALPDGKFAVAWNDGRSTEGDLTYNVFGQVFDVNNDPVVANPIPDQAIPENTAWNYSVAASTFSDPDGDPLAYSATLESGAPLPAWLGFDAATRTFSGSPPASFNGLVILKVTASDGTLSASDSFTLAVSQVSPTITAFSPADGATGVGVTSNLVFTFSEAIQRGTGTISLRTGSATGPVVEQFDAATSARLSISGTTLTIDPTANLQPGTQYFLTLAGGTVKDLTGNAFAGSTSYDFTSFGVASTPVFRAFAPTGFSMLIKPQGQVFGTDGLQDVGVITQLPGFVSFDPSFNRGGDIVRVNGSAALWQIARSGSSAILSDGDTALSIPVGTVGLALVFGDGARTLKFDDTTGVMKIGSQAFTEQPATVTAALDGTVLPTAIDANAFGRIYLSGGTTVLGGKFDVFGSNAAEALSVTSGELRLDPSFNRGGDIISFPNAAPNYTAVQKGSSVLLDSASIDVTIPVGAATQINFSTSVNGQVVQDDRVLIFDAATSAIRLDDQTIGATPVSLAPFS